MIVELVLIDRVFDSVERDEEDGEGGTMGLEMIEVVVMDDVGRAGGT